MATVEQTASVMIIDRVLTFVGAFLAIEFWYYVLSMQGASSMKPTDSEFPFARFMIPAAVASLFLIADVLINRRPAEDYSRVVLGSLLVGFAGSIALVLILLLAMFVTEEFSLAVFAHRRPAERFSAVPLALTAFIAILLLRSIYFGVSRILSRGTTSGNE